MFSLLNLYKKNIKQFFYEFRIYINYFFNIFNINLDINITILYLKTVFLVYLCGIEILKKPVCYTEINFVYLYILYIYNY